MDYDRCISHEDIRKNPDLLPNAVKYGYKKVVECFVTYSVDNGYAVQYPSLLHVAVEEGHTAIIEPLLKLGYDINSKDKKGKMPIHYSMSCDEKKRSNWIEIFQILLAHGATVEKAPELLHEAVNKECLEICRILIENFNVDTNALNIGGHTPLLALVTRERGFHRREQVEIDKTAQIAELLLGNGADVHSVAEHGYNVLHIAAENGMEGVVRILLHFGANVNERAKYGYIDGDCDYKSVTNGPIALHLAAMRGHTEVVKVLLEFDADIDTQEGHENITPLHIVAMGDNHEVAIVLLENGCDVNIEDYKGETALKISIDTYGDFDDEYEDAHEPNWVQPPDVDHNLVGKALIMHVIKSEVAGLCLNEKNLQHLTNLHPVLIAFQVECKNEINTLKGVKLCCHLTLYDLLLDLKNPAYSKNESFSQTLCSLSFNNYPIYGGLIKNSFEKNRRRAALLISGKESLDILMKTKTALDEKKLPILVEDVSAGIFLYLNNNELRNLISAGQSIRNQVCK